MDHQGSPHRCFFILEIPSLLSFQIGKPFYESLWRRKWQPTPVFLPRESHGWKGLVGYGPRVANSRIWLSDFTFTSTLLKKSTFFPFTINKYWGVAVSGCTYLVVQYDVNSWNLIQQIIIYKHDYLILKLSQIWPVGAPSSSVFFWHIPIKSHIDRIFFKCSNEYHQDTMRKIQISSEL